MLPSRTNTISLRVGIGALLLALFVGIVFASLVSATNDARRADRAAEYERELLTTAANAQLQVATARTADAAAVRVAARVANAAAKAADRAPRLGPTVGDQIRAATTTYSSNPAIAQTVLMQVLGSVTARQEVAAGQRADDLDSSLTQARQYGVIGLIGAALTMVLFGREMLRSIIRPMRRLAAAAKRLGSGDLSMRVSERGAADLKALARSLNSMAVSLHATRKALDAQQTQVASSRDETNRANAAKNEFLSRMSHELRTPLNAILGFAQLLELDELDSRQRDNVAHIVSGGRHLLDLINEVLEISRIEAGSINPVIEPVHAAEMVREALELVGPLASRRGIELSTAESGSNLWIDADPQRLKQVLLNLLANAVKYNREGGSVTVRIKDVGGRVRIAVTDTGQGIPQDQLPRLFIPFERLGAESTGVEGTGLGLVLALRLVEAMNGTLGVESQPWIGSTFHIELPLVEAPAEALGPPLPQRVIATGPEPAMAGSSGTQRVLYIEDDAANAHLMSQLFAEEPRLELMTTMYGKLGLELARQHVPDLILLDAHLPDLGGDEVLKRLRADAATRSIPVIAVSADASEEQRARMTALGAARYLTKPLTLNVVLTAVWEVLDPRALTMVEAGRA